MSLVKQPTVYIMASRRNGAVYTGVTSNLSQRVWQHKHGIFAGFTSMHNVDSLVYYEMYDVMKTAITREKQLKHWNRAWKLRLIEERNPEWKDLYDEICELQREAD